MDAEVDRAGKWLLLCSFANFSPTVGSTMRQQVNLVIQQLREQVATPEEQAALGALHYVADDGERCIIEVKPLLAPLVRERLLSRVQELLTESLGRPVRVQIRATRSPQRELFPFLNSTDADEEGLGGPTSKSLTFQHFVVGPSNQFAHAAAIAVSRNPGKQYNPLFIYGGVGLGKTHLLHAIAEAVREQYPEMEVRYLNSDAFMAEVVYAIRRDRLAHFKTRFHRVDVLLVDDVQLLAGRERTQEEFFHIINALHELNKQIVLAADKPPNDLTEIDERLRNRFAWGLVVDIQPPDLETRIAILQRKAQLEGVEIPYDLALTLAEAAGQSVRELNALLTRLLALASLTGTPLTLALAEKVIGASQRAQAQTVTLEKIQQAVADFFGLRPTELRSPRRSRVIATARHIAMYLCRHELGASFPYIGECFGGRDHSTVIHAVDRIERRQAVDPELRRIIESLRQSLGSGENARLFSWKNLPG